MMQDKLRIFYPIQVSAVVQYQALTKLIMKQLLLSLMYFSAFLNWDNVKEIRNPWISTAKYIECNGNTDKISIYRLFL